MLGVIQPVCCLHALLVGFLENLMVATAGCWLRWTLGLVQQGVLPWWWHCPVKTEHQDSPFVDTPHCLTMGQMQFPLPSDACCSSKHAPPVTDTSLSSSQKYLLYSLELVHSTVSLILCVPVAYHTRKSSMVKFMRPNWIFRKPSQFVSPNVSPSPSPPALLKGSLKIIIIF